MKYLDKMFVKSHEKKAQQQQNKTNQITHTHHAMPKYTDANTNILQNTLNSISV